MSNVVYEDKFFNEDNKKKFIEQYATGTQKILLRIFKVSYPVESDFNKDLFSFNREQLRRLFYLYMPKTEYSSRANVTWVSKYIDWAIEEGYMDGLNPLDGTTKEWKEQFANKNMKKYWTRFEIEHEISGKLVNAQDAVVVSLLFNGVRGIGNSEILNLTKDNLDIRNHRLELNDLNGKKRTITVSEHCTQLCEKALGEIDYEKKNGNPSPDTKSPIASLVTNKFVVKSSKTRTEHYNEAEKNIVHRRLANIAADIDEPNFSPLNIVYSGMLAMACDLLEANGKLEDEEYAVICEQFDIPLDQSLYRYKNEFLNAAFIEAMYERP